MLYKEYGNIRDISFLIRIQSYSRDMRPDFMLKYYEFYSPIHETYNQDFLVCLVNLAFKFQPIFWYEIL